MQGSSIHTVNHPMQVSGNLSIRRLRPHCKGWPAALTPRKQQHMHAASNDQNKVVHAQ